MRSMGPLNTLYKTAMGLEVQDMSFEASPTLMLTAFSVDVRRSGDRVVITIIISSVEVMSLANASWNDSGWNNQYNWCAENAMY
jgi:hypothetical protein